MPPPPIPQMSYFPLVKGLRKARQSPGEEFFSPLLYSHSERAPLVSRRISLLFFWILPLPIAVCDIHLQYFTIAVTSNLAVTRGRGFVTYNTFFHINLILYSNIYQNIYQHVRAVGGRRSQEFIILPALPPPSSHLYTPCCITMYYIIHTRNIHTHTDNTRLEISYTLLHYHVLHYTHPTRNTHTHTYNTGLEISYTLPSASPDIGNTLD